jgi:hypothetical protein
MLSKIKQTVREELSLRHERKYEKTILNSFKKNSFALIKSQLTSQQEKEIQDFYVKHLGHKIDLSYHAYYHARNGIFSPEYVPTSIYKARIAGRLNDFRQKDAYIDKNQFDKLFPQINHPKAVIKCINGYFYNDNQPISKDDAVQLCSNINDVIIKPSLESIHGSKVASFVSENGITDKGIKVEELFNSYGKHFIVQERLKQHEGMSALNPTSVNTVRLFTYRRGNTIELLYAVVRIGRKGKIIDNESSGGITTKIDSNGRLDRFAYSTPTEGKLEQTDSGIIINGYEIPSFDKVVNIVKTLHLQLPYFNLAGWDIAVGVDGEPVFIEWNARTELSQTAVGPAFGKFTEEVLEMARTLPTTRYYIIGQRNFNE